MAKINPISGFMEFLPAEQKLFQKMMDIVRHHYELYGFSQIETSAIERVDTLLAKGGSDKEIYGLRRLAAEEGQSDEKDLALHFDLTVPLARYVSQNYGKLFFPFKRYQMQPVWRGERPQAGRYRQFYQCDIDVIGNGSLPLAYDAEAATIIYRIFREMNIGKFVIRINNRKALQGILSSFGASDDKLTALINIIDDMEKSPKETIIKRLEELDLASDKASSIIDLFSEKLGKAEWIAKLKSLPQNDLLSEGINELEYVIQQMQKLNVDDEYFVIDPSIARGLDYYTGTVYETKLVDYPEIGSICSGGRYENLLSGFSNQNLPGVGISIGLTRLVPQLIKAGLLSADGQVGADVLVTAMDKNFMDEYLEIGEELRQAGIPTEVLYEAKKFDKQMKFANNKGFKVVIIAGENEIKAGEVTVKDLISGEQKVVAKSEVVEAVKGILK